MINRYFSCLIMLNSAADFDVGDFALCPKEIIKADWNNVYGGNILERNDFFFYVEFPEFSNTAKSKIE